MGGAQSYGASEGAATGSLVLGQFTDPGTDGTAADYSATIAWGDGTTSPGTVSLVGGSTFQVTGSHAYTEQGSFAVTATITDGRGASLALNAATVSVIPLKPDLTIPVARGTAPVQPNIPSNPTVTPAPRLPAPQPRQPAPRPQVSQPDVPPLVVDPIKPRGTGNVVFTALPPASGTMAYPAGKIQMASQEVGAPNTGVASAALARSGHGMTPAPLSEGEGTTPDASTATNPPASYQANAGRDTGPTGSRATPRR